MEVHSVPIPQLSEDPANVRKHGDRNLEAIKASLQRFGQPKPIVAGTDNVVVAGNGTLAAARSLGWETIAVVYTDLQGSERTAFAIADNRTAELAEWDDGLPDLLSQLQHDDSIDQVVTGFNDSEIDDLIAGWGSGGGSRSEGEQVPCVIVSCQDEASQKQAHDLLTQEGFTCRSRTLSSNHAVFKGDG
jgi:ParB-like chromosome segregation protein Spo0J